MSARSGHPDWHRTIGRYPTVTVATGATTYAAAATLADGREHDARCVRVVDAIR